MIGALIVYGVVIVLVACAAGTFDSIVIRFPKWGKR